jgi:hypothetical protein
MNIVPFRRWQTFFTLAGLYNFAAAAGGLFAPELMYQLMYQVSAPVGPAGTQDRMFVWVAVGLFGVGYMLVGRNPFRNHAVIVLGILGKSYAVIVWAGAWFIGKAGPTAMLAAVGDGLWVLGFCYGLWWLRQNREN